MSSVSARFWPFFNGGKWVTFCCLLLLGVRNRDEPTPRHPQLISGTEIGWRIIERAGPYLNFVRAGDDRKDGRPTHGTEVAIVGRKLPASSLTSDLHLARLPHSEEVAERFGLLPADLAVAKAHPHRSPIDLKLHLTAVAATRSLQHEILPLRTRIYHILRAAMESQGRGARHHPPLFAPTTPSAHVSRRARPSRRRRSALHVCIPRT